ncbi:MAG: tetratricopeptide repeat protein [Nitrospiria bacterium]
MKSAFLFVHTPNNKGFVKRVVYIALLLFHLGCQESNPLAQGASSDVVAPPVVAQNRNPLPTPAPQPRSPHPPAAPPHAPSAEAVPFMQKLQGFKARLEKDPKDLEALIFLANSNFDIQRFEKAQSLYLRALEVDPDNLHVRTDLASAYRHLGHSDKAVTALQIVLKINPNHQVALYNLGIILLNDQNDPPGAADAWERLVQINPNDPLAEELRQKIKTIREGKLKTVPQE